MVAVESAAIARALSKFKRPPDSVPRLASYFNVPESLWARIEHHVAQSSVEEPKRLLLDLFDLSASSKQKVLIGSLLLEHGVNLTANIEMAYVRSLLDCGLAPQALKVWQQRHANGGKISKETYLEYLTTIYCRSLRVLDAERVAGQVEATPRMAMEFVRAYAQLRNIAGVDNWTTRLVRLEHKPYMLRASLECLIKAKMWRQAQRVIAVMTACGLTVPSDVSAACVLAAKGNATEGSVASLLSKDGTIVQSPLFQLAIGQDPRRTIDDLLQKGSLTAAIQMLKSYKGHHDLALCNRVLRRLLPQARDDRDNFISQMQPVLEYAQQSSDRSARYVQFMLLYLREARQFDELWSLVSSYRLATLNPAVPISARSYWLIWSAVHSAVRSRQHQVVPFSLRQFLLVTVSKCELGPRLLHSMALSFAAVSDLQGLVTLLEFAGENCGVRIGRATSQALLPTRKLQSRHWRTVANALCEQDSRSLSEVQLSAKNIRLELNMQ